MSRKLLLEKAEVTGIRGYEVYSREGGYQSVEKALKQMTPDQVTDEVKKAVCVVVVVQDFPLE